MGTGIEWTDETWNPLAAFDRETGERGWFCTKISPGCKHCYAEALNKRLGTGHEYTVPNLEEIEFRLVNLERPLQWQRSGKHCRVFVNSMTDLFHEAVPDEMLDRMFTAMALAPDITFQILTKRPARMAEYMSGDRWQALIDTSFEMEREGLIDPFMRDGSGDNWWPLENVWLGTSVEDQERADERIPQLLQTPAAVRFLSCEPLLGELNLEQVHTPSRDALLFPLSGRFICDGMNEPHRIEQGGLDWIIVGGESGPKARTMCLSWARAIVGQCRQAGVPVFVKQLGARPALCADRGEPEEALLRLEHSKGGDAEEWPKDLRVRQFPEVVR